MNNSANDGTHGGTQWSIGDHFNCRKSKKEVQTKRSSITLEIDESRHADVQVISTSAQLVLLENWAVCCH